MESGPTGAVLLWVLKDDFMTTHTIAIFVVMNENGDYVVASDEDTALDLFEEEQLGDDSGCHPRMVKLNVTMAPPVATEANEAPPVVIEVNVTVPNETGHTD
jgi:hypothetical protein